jgi:hypothetical protein
MLDMDQFLSPSEVQILNILLSIVVTRHQVDIFEVPIMHR